LSLNSACYTLFTCKSIDNNTEDKLHANNVDDEEDGDVVDPSDVVPDPVLVGVRRSKEHVSHTTRRSWAECSHHRETLEQSVAHVLSCWLHCCHEESIINVGEGEETVEVEQDYGEESCQEKLGLVVRDGLDYVAQCVEPILYLIQLTMMSSRWIE
jgi:hypothetical protein